MQRFLGEVRIYVGGHIELQVSDGLITPVWITGRMIAKARYQNKFERRKIVEKALELYHEVEIGIVPDDVPEPEIVEEIK